MNLYTPIPSGFSPSFTPPSFSDQEKCSHYLRINIYGEKACKSDNSNINDFINWRK